eukprot:13489255-Ditylum_brightwellii.AAC.1
MKKIPSDSKHHAMHGNNITDGNANMAIKNKSNNSKQQGQASDTSQESKATTTNNNNQQNKEIPGRDHHSCAAIFMQGSSKPFGSCPVTPKQLPQPVAIFTSESEGKRQKR